MHELIRDFITQKFGKASFSLNITPKDPNISPITKFHKLFKRLWSIRV